jgi:hypothetical protein
MATFGRAFRTGRLCEAVLRENVWLCDLLRHWHPSGDAIGKRPEQVSERHLRLAIRNGYLNFYRAGQSVAKVTFDRRRKPQAEIHNKYVYDDGTGQDYVKLTSEGYRKRASEPWLPYEGPALLREWISRTYKYGRGDEKPFVDLIVSRNPNVIDLEMGLPAYSEVRTAPRMDLVGLEPAGDQWRVVFWEAKLVGDRRARCREGLPRVITHQLKHYTDWLDDSNHVELVARAYQSTCRLLVELHSIARQLRPDVEELGSGIREVATPGAPLPLIDVKPRLLIDAYTRKDTSFTNKHLEKLLKTGLHVQMVQGEDQMTLNTLP